MILQDKDGSVFFFEKKKKGFQSFFFEKRKQIRISKKNGKEENLSFFFEKKD
jgi:hypothetical protein